MFLIKARFFDEEQSIIEYEITIVESLKDAKKHCQAYFQTLDPREVKHLETVFAVEMELDKAPGYSTLLEEDVCGPFPEGSIAKKSI